MRDRINLIQNLLKIDNKERQTVPFVLNDIQLKIIKERGHRNLILKARQLGISSFILADMFIEAITVPNTVCVVVSHESFAAQRLLDKVHFFYNTFPEPKPLIGAESRYEISFPPLHSVIYIGTAKAMVFVGRGDTINKLHLSEFAFYDDPEEMLNAAEEAVPLNGELTIETTPNGMDNYFYEIWSKAKEGRSGYKPFFFPWWTGKDYYIPKGSPLALFEDRGELIYDEEEKELVSRFNLTEDQIRWRRRKLADKGGLFYQEYPEDELTCFQYSGAPVFDSYITQQLVRDCYDGERHPQGFVIWKHPVERVNYIIGADCSEGIHTYSAAVVLDDNYHVCATFQAKLEPYQFASILKVLGNYYNYAELAVERNAQGYAVLANLTDYPNIHYQRDFVTGKITTRPGWWTSEATKTYMLTTFKDILPRFKTWDINLVRQIRGYRYVKLRPTAQSFDDLLVAAMIAVAVKKVTGGSKGFIGVVSGWNW